MFSLLPAQYCVWVTKSVSYRNGNKALEYRNSMVPFFFPDTLLFFVNFGIRLQVSTSIHKSTFKNPATSGPRNHLFLSATRSFLKVVIFVLMSKPGKKKGTSWGLYLKNFTCTHMRQTLEYSFINPHDNCADTPTTWQALISSCFR